MLPDKQLDELHDMFAEKFRKAAAAEDVAQAVSGRYERGLDAIQKILWQLSNRSYMEEEDYLCCPKCGERVLDEGT